MKAVNSRIIHQLSIHNRFRSYAPAISSNTITRCLYVGKKDISSLFANSLTQPTFSHSLSEAYVANLISTEIDKFFALHFTIAKSTTHRTIGISSLSRHSRRILRTRQLSCLQAACPIHRPINARNDLSPIGWQRFLDSNLLISSVQLQKLLFTKGSKRELFNIVYGRRPMYARTFTPFLNWVSYSINWANHFSAN